MHVPAALCDRHVLLRADHPSIVRSLSPVQQTVRTSIVYQKVCIQLLLTDVCPPLLTNISYRAS